MKKIMYAFLFLFSFLSQIQSFASEKEQQQTIIKKYLEETKDSERVLVVGGGAKYFKYPPNYFLFDIAEGVRPHIAGDITSKEFYLSKYFKDFPFSTVILEHLSSFAIKEEQTLININNILKKGGKLYSNKFFSYSSLEEKTSDLIPFSDKAGLYVVKNAFETQPNPFTIFYDKDNLTYDYKEASDFCFNDLIKPLFERNGFINIKLVQNQYQTTTCLKEFIIMEMENS